MWKSRKFMNAANKLHRKIVKPKVKRKWGKHMG